MFNIENVEMKVIGIWNLSIRFGFKMLVNDKDVIVYCEFDTVSGDSKWFAANFMMSHPSFINELLLIVQPKLDVYLQDKQVKEMRKTKNKEAKN